MKDQRFQHTVSMSEGDDEDLRLLLIGKTGSGKSATGNIIFNDRVFESVMSSSSVTRSCKSHTDDVNNRRVRVVDTPDFIFSTHTDFDSDSELKKALELCSPGAHVILLTLSLSTFTEQEKDFIDWFEQKFGVEALRFTVVLFTHAGQRHMRTLAEMIRMNPQLSAFINRCRGGFCEMNIKAPTNRGQVTELMQKINRLISENSCYTLNMMKETERRREEERERRAEEERREEERRREERERRAEEERREEERRRAEEERREREHQMELERVRRETENSVRRELERENKKKYVSIFMVCAVVSGGVLWWRRDSSHGWMLFKRFKSGGSVRVLTEIVLMLKSSFVCSSSHERPSAVRQFILETAGECLVRVFANCLKSVNLVSVSAGLAGVFTGIFLSLGSFVKQ